MTCKNCKEDFEGNFCNNCGQKCTVRKVDSRYFLEEISNSVFQLNRGLLFTLKELFSRPGHSIREYVEGKRKNHYKPLSFLLLVSAIYVLVKSFIVEPSNPQDKEVIREFSPILLKAIEWLKNNQGYSILLYIPFFTLGSTLAFRKSRYNYFEHLILNLYVSGQQMVIYLVFTIPLKGIFEGWLPFFIALGVNLWTYIQFFNKNKVTKNILLTLLAYSIFVIQLFVLVIIIVGIIATTTDAFN